MLSDRYMDRASHGIQHEQHEELGVQPQRALSRKLRRKLSTPIIRHPSYFVGLILRGCSLPWPNFGHVVLARPSPILFYPISSTEVSLTSFCLSAAACIGLWLMPLPPCQLHGVSPTSSCLSEAAFVCGEVCQLCYQYLGTLPGHELRMAWSLRGVGYSRVLSRYACAAGRSCMSLICS